MASTEKFASGFDYKSVSMSERNHEAFGNLIIKLRMENFEEQNKPNLGDIFRILFPWEIWALLKEDKIKTSGVEIYRFLVFRVGLMLAHNMNKLLKGLKSFLIWKKKCALFCLGEGLSLFMEVPLFSGCLVQYSYRGGISLHLQGFWINHCGLVFPSIIFKI